MGISCYVGIACFVIIGSSGDVYDDGVELQTEPALAKSSLLCWGPRQGGRCWPSEAGLGSEPEEPPLVGAWAPLAG